MILKYHSSITLNANIEYILFYGEVKKTSRNKNVLLLYLKTSKSNNIFIGLLQDVM